jgi:hypothetical protein
VFGRVHHIGFVVANLAAAERHLAIFGYTRRGDPVRDDYQRAELMFLVRPGADPSEPLLELIRPLDEQAPTYASMSRSQFQIHHLCYITNDIAEAVTQARSGRFSQVQPITAAPAIGGSRIAFFYARAVGLFEVVERPPF